MLSIEAFEHLKDIYIFFVFILAALFIMIVFLRKYIKLINWVTVVSISIICSVVSSLILMFMGYVADEMNYQVTGFTSLYIVIIGLSVVNSFIP